MEMLIYNCLRRVLTSSFFYDAGYNFEASYPESEAPSQWTEPCSNSLPISTNGESHGAQSLGQGQGLGGNLAASSTNTARKQAPDPEVQRAFLQFLVENHNLLQSLPDSSRHSISRIREAFEQNIPEYHLQLVSNPSADLDMMIQQFKPKVATSAIRRESDNRKKNKSAESSTGSFVCPFRFCDGHFTRGIGLQNHLGAHFRLKPCRCGRCGRYYSDTAFKRHKYGCKA
ncbi:hypothetical protein BDN70DRAFT_248668 [Pholiota conissans]|uniref:C2H2-type domain-containing protein n=1 Tax=Pholiota conissans TaxID=109636 RepID=A0A9P5YVT4_9AGAR|nr:hypothetical protein BDN70DRAFT_248668 [Pholiota conissans]